MEKMTLTHLRDYIEPAPPMVVKFREELIAIYAVIREKFQSGIDKAFDSISKQIGFVVTTRIPLVLNVGEKGKVADVTIGAEYLKSTIFDKEITPLFKESFSIPFKSDPMPAAGKFFIYAIWYEALRLRIHTEWVEPAHISKPGLESFASKFMRQEPMEQYRRPWDVIEPAHFMEPGPAISMEEALILSAIDKVYPELLLVQRMWNYPVKPVEMP